MTDLYINGMLRLIWGIIYQARRICSKKRGRIRVQTKMRKRVKANEKKKNQ